MNVTVPSCWLVSPAGILVVTATYLEDLFQLSTTWNQRAFRNCLLIEEGEAAIFNSIFIALWLVV